MKLNLIAGVPVALAAVLMLSACDTNKPAPSAPSSEASSSSSAPEAAAPAEAAPAEAAPAEATPAEAAAPAAAPAEAAPAEAAPAEAAAPEAAPAEAAPAETAAPPAEAPAPAPETAAAPPAEQAAPVAAAVVAPKLPATGLSTDTLAAAGGRSGDGFGYVGVWAVSADACATVDQPGGSGYAVITAATFRDGPSASYGNFGALKDGKLTIKAGQRSIDIAQTAPDALTIAGTAYIRCTP